jgi:16S rRNA processing protein RimM
VTAQHGEQPELVVAGVVGKAFGIKGETYVFGDPDFDEPFAVGTAYPATRPDGRPAGELVVARSAIHKGRRIVRFEGVEDRDAAEALRGLRLHVPRGEVQLDPDAFWTADLLGREVLDDDGAVVGVVEAALDGAAHDYLVVARPDGGEVLIPAVPQLVEVTADAVVVHAIPGLLDPDEVG